MYATSTIKAGRLFSISYPSTVTTEAVRMAARLAKDIKKAVKTLAETVGWRKRYKMLLIGETGAGKTSFLNLICNYNLVLTLGFETGIKEFHEFHQLQFESNTRQMESKTNNATMYKVEVGDWSIGVIDTPGFGDSRGMAEDKKHIQKIVEAVKQEQYINCVCLVTNGRAARMSATLKYVLAEVTAILPKSIIDNVIVVFTNTSSIFHLTFDVSELKTFFGRKLEHYFCIENPYCLYEKIKNNQKDLPIDEVAEALKSKFERTATILNHMFKQIESFRPVHTNGFTNLYEKKKEVEHTVLITLNEYNNQMRLEERIKQEEVKLKAASMTKVLNEKFESKVDRIVSKKTAHYNMLCGAPGCYSNCHVNCSCFGTKQFDKETFKKCSAINSSTGTCNVCGHDYRHHYHNEALFELKKESIIDETTKAKYEAAKTDEDRAKVAKQNLQQLKVKSEQKKRNLSQQLAAAIGEFQAIGVARSYQRMLENQLLVIEQCLLADERNKEYLKVKEDLEKRIKVVKESMK
jgi:GTP-binding protein EngB required for normal cell division